MKSEVAFDLRAAEGSPTGVGRHMLSIVQALAEHRPDVPLRVYVRGEVAGLPAGVRVVRIASKGPLWHLRVWRHVRRHPVRAYCSTSLIIPALSRGPALPVVLDVISFLYPQYHKMRTRLAERLLMGRVVRRHVVVAGSETTSRDIARVFGRVRTCVVPPWPAPALQLVRNEAALERLGLKPPYALYLGTVEPRKNVLTAARAVASLRAAGTDVTLAIVGGRGWIGEAELRELRDLQASGVVVWTGYIPDEDRDAIMASATCLVLPSVYEGFGLPLLEAMQRGVPCVCSTAPAFEEVAGDAAIRVEPFEVPGWANGIRLLLEDRAEVERLVAAGRVAAGRFTSEATARRFCEALALLD